MPRAPFALILILAAALSGCDREPPKPPPAPVKSPSLVKEAPPQAEAQAPPPVDLAGLDEDAALVALMKHEVTTDDDADQQALARFAPADADTLLAKPVALLPDYLRPSDADAAELARSSLQLVEQQVPADIRDAIRAAGKVKVLVVESCGADVGAALGVPNDFDEGSAQPYLDQARFDAAMERERLKPVALPADFRDMEGDREAVAAVNRQLFELRRSGKTKDILVILDLSTGCGAEGKPVTLATEPPYESLRILPAFYFTVCGQRAEDAWSPAQCRWWETVTQALTMDRGTYYYVARWPDGLEKRGRFVIDDLVTEAIEEGQDTLTLDIR